MAKVPRLNNVNHAVKTETISESTEIKRLMATIGHLDTVPWAIFHGSTNNIDWKLA